MHRCTNHEPWVFVEAPPRTVRVSRGDRKVQSPSRSPLAFVATALQGLLIILPQRRCGLCGSNSCVRSSSQNIWSSVDTTRPLSFAQRIRTYCPPNEAAIALQTTLFRVTMRYRQAARHEDSRSRNKMVAGGADDAHLRVARRRSYNDN